MAPMDVKQRFDPARAIIVKLGGEARVARVCETALTAPYRWQHPKERGGTGGQIPQKHIPALLAEARRLGINLPAEEFHAAPTVSKDCEADAPSTQPDSDDLAPPKPEPCE